MLSLKFIRVNIAKKRVMIVLYETARPGKYYK